MTRSPAGTRTRDSALTRFIADERALAITEYGMLVTFVAIAIIAVLSIYGSQIGSWFASRTGSITTV